MAASILLVDSSPANLSVLRTLLGQDGHEVIAADTGQAALDILKTNPAFDLVLVEVSMPDMDGLAVCRALKADPVTKPIPIVLLSDVKTGEEDIRQGLNAGADGYLVRPIEDLALRAWVRATLRLGRFRREFADVNTRANAAGNDATTALAALKYKLHNHLQALYAAADLLFLRMQEDSGNRALVSQILAQAEQVAALIAGAGTRTGKT